jgi:putative hydrolase of the HAD superfamily
MEKTFRTVFFDLGGTLRICREDPAYQAAARAEMARLSGTGLNADEFFALVEKRYEPYRTWALTENREAGDEELWHRWLLPEMNAALLKKNCHALTFQYRQTKGFRTVAEGVVETLQELKRRGYRLAIISNLIGETEIGDWLAADGLASLFDSVVLSSVCHIRKPDPEIYRIAMRELHVTPAECVSVADNLGRDITGARACGLGLCVLFRSPEKKHPLEINDQNRPDRIIDRLPELLTFLPGPGRESERREYT